MNKFFSLSRADISFRFSFRVRCSRCARLTRRDADRRHPCRPQTVCPSLAYRAIRLYQTSHVQTLYSFAQATADRMTSFPDGLKTQPEPLHSSWADCNRAFPPLRVSHLDRSRGGHELLSLLVVEPNLIAFGTVQSGLEGKDGY